MMIAIQYATIVLLLLPTLLLTSDSNVLRKKYTLQVITGTDCNAHFIRCWDGAGTDGKVKVVLVGAHKASDPIVLDTKGHNDFESGQKGTYNITVDRSIGPVIGLAFELWKTFEGVWGYAWQLKNAILWQVIYSPNETYGEPIDFQFNKWFDEGSYHRVNVSECIISDWSEWTVCSSTCIGGKKYRMRHIFAKASSQQDCGHDAQVSHCNSSESLEC